jgi:hypothetical protein
MTEAADGRGNLAAKLDAFLASCLLRRWRDALAVLRSAGRSAALAAECEELGITSRCVEAVAMLITDPGGGNAAAAATAASSSSSPWWALDVSDLRVDLFWRVMVAVKAAGTVKGRAVGDALRTYARRWLPTVVKSGYLVVEQTGISTADEGSFDFEVVARNSQLLVEKMVSLLPAERNAVSCSFLLKLLKAANVLGASPASKAELIRRAALQLEDASVSDLLIPSCASETLYDVDDVMAILEELALRQAAAGVPEASPPHARGHRRSRSAESSEFEGARRSTSAAASHGAMVRIGRLVDGFLMEVAKDPNLPLDKLIAIAEAVPDCARPEHDHLYRAVDTYLRVRGNGNKHHHFSQIDFDASLFLGSIYVTGASGDGQGFEEEAVQGSQLQEAIRDGVHARRPERAAAAPGRRAGALLRERTRGGGAVRPRGQQQPRRRRGGWRQGVARQDKERGRRPGGQERAKAPAGPRHRAWP